MDDEQKDIVGRLAKSISKLQAKVLERKLGQMIDYAFEVMDETANPRIKRAAMLESAWLKYGRHSHDCQRHGMYQCSCGFVETCNALAQLGKTENQPSRNK
jgi:hypothetical protein